MSTVDDTQGLQVELAKLGGVDLKSERLIVTAITTVGEYLTSTFGKDWGMTNHSQGILMIVLAVIAGVHVLSRSIHHAAVETGNAAVKTSLISAAQKSNTPVATDSAPDTSGIVTDAPVADPVVVNDTADAAVGADLPTSDATAAVTTVPAAVTTAAPA